MTEQPLSNPVSNNASSLTSGRILARNTIWNVILMKDGIKRMVNNLKP